MIKTTLRERAFDMLLCVLETSDEIPDLTRLNKAQLTQICEWASVMTFEASDNPCRARHAPRCLRDLIPEGHYLQKWRMPKGRAS